MWWVDLLHIIIGTGGGIGSGSVVELPVTGTKNGCSVSTQETQEQDENINAMHTMHTMPAKVTSFQYELWI